MRGSASALALLAAALLLGACQKSAEQGGQQTAASQPAIQWKMQSLWQSGTPPWRV